MSNASVAKARSVADILGDATARKTNVAQQQTVAKQDNKFAQIESNEFYKILFEQSTDANEKKELLAKLLTSASSKDENREHVKNYQIFEEYLQEVRETMAKKIIGLTDTDAYSELQKTYQDMNGNLLDFDEKMKPLTEIIDAIYVLRINDKTVDAFKEIQDDRKQEVENKQRLHDLTDEVDNLKNDIKSAKSNIIILQEEKSFFGFGGIKPQAKAEINRLNDDIAEYTNRLEEIEGEIRSLDETHRESMLGEFAEQKAKLRELLDVSSDTHKNRQKDLVNAALNFVNTTKDRVGSVRSHLGDMGSQIEGLYDSNSKMSNIYAIMSEGIKEAETRNKSLREQFLPAENEGIIAKTEREEKKTVIEDHMRVLDAAGANTLATHADITSQTIRIKTMRDSNEDQIDKARKMHSEGVAGVADRLSVVLQAVSSAAINEASSLNKDTLTKMKDNTDRIAQKESIRVAMGIDDLNDDLKRAFDGLSDYGVVLNKATEIRREGLAEMHSSLDRLKELAQSVKTDVHNAIAVNADVNAGTSALADSRTQASATDSPFKL